MFNHDDIQSKLGSSVADMASNRDEFSNSVVGEIDKARFF